MLTGLDDRIGTDDAPVDRGARLEAAHDDAVRDRHALADAGTCQHHRSLDARTRSHDGTVGDHRGADHRRAVDVGTGCHRLARLSGAAAVDEILGSLNWLLAGPAVTARLECDFRRPVPVGSQLFIDAEVVGVKGRKVFTRAVGRLGAPDGPMAVSAAALFVQVPLQHFVDHGTPEHVQQAIEDRAKGGPAWRPEGEQHTVEVNP